MRIFPQEFRALNSPKKHEQLRENFQELSSCQASAFAILRVSPFTGCSTLLNGLNWCYLVEEFCPFTIHGGSISAWAGKGGFAMSAKRGSGNLVLAKSIGQFLTFSQAWISSGKP